MQFPRYFRVFPLLLLPSPLSITYFHHNITPFTTFPRYFHEISSPLTISSINGGNKRFSQLTATFSSHFLHIFVKFSTHFRQIFDITPHQFTTWLRWSEFRGIFSLFYAWIFTYLKFYPNLCNHFWIFRRYPPFFVTSFPLSITISTILSPPFLLLFAFFHYHLK